MVEKNFYSYKYHEDPFANQDYYWIDPQKIVYVSKIEFHFTQKDKIVAGDWDKSKKKFEEFPFFKAYYGIINQNKKWPETGYYQDAVQKILNGRIMWGCRSTLEFEEACKKMDEIYESIKENGYELSTSTGVMREDEVAISIGRHGDMLFSNGRHRLTFAKLLELEKIPVKITVRHPEWVKFKDKILYYAKNHGGKVYAPLTHIDLQSIPSHYSDKRFEIIKKNSALKKGTLLDIGSHWGYFCHKFEEEGFECYACENNAGNLYFLEKLKRAEDRHFAIISESIFSFCKKRKKFDIVLALSILHHFLKEKRTFYQLIELLENIQMKELFFQPSLPDEKQMESAYKNFDCDEFAQFIVEHSCLKKSALIGYGENKRPLYKLY